MAIVLSGSTGIQNPLGSAAAPSESNTTNSNTGAYFPTGTTYGIATNGSNAMYINASQNVGIGTTSPSTKLNVYGASVVGRFESTNNTNVVALAYNGTVGGYLGANGTNLIFGNNSGTEAMRIDSSGNVGIGTSAPGLKLVVAGTGGAATIGLLETGVRQWLVRAGGAATNLFDIADYTAGASRLVIDSSGNVGIGTTSPSYPLSISKTTVGGSVWANVNNTDTTSGSTAGYFASNGSVNAIMGSSSFAGTGTYGMTTNHPALFITNNTERMRIDSSGNLLVGYTTSNGAYKLQVNSQIFATSATIATSDANYKTNVTPLSGALNLVQKLNPVSFNWIKHPVHNFDTDTPTVGFLAQEVQAALADTSYVNSIVKQSEVTLPDDTKEKFLGIAEGNMIALLTKAIQELSAEVTALKAKVGA